MTSPVDGRLRKPLPHQRKPIAFAADRARAAIFMDKRLGKCVVALRHALWHGARHALIVAPLSACPGWLDELEADGLRGIFLHGGTFEEREERFMQSVGELQHDPEPIFYVINPEGLFKSKGRQRETCPTCDGVGSFDVGEGVMCTACEGRGTVPSAKAKPHVSAVALYPWDEVIWDESTNLRNTRSQLAEVANGCFHDIKNKVILSGEYAPEGPQDVFGQMRFLLGRFMGHTNFFAWRDENFDHVGYDWIPKKGRFKLIRQAIEAHAVILSRKSAGLGEIKTTERRVVELPPTVRKAYDHAERYFEIPPDYVGDEADANPGMAKYAVVVRNWLAQIAGGFPKHFPKLTSDHKMKLLVDLVTREYAREPLVVTFRYNGELFTALEALRRDKVACEPITGATTPVARRDLQKRFKAGSLRVLLMQCRVARFGIDLSAADTMIRYSLPDPFEDISQPMDRIVHPLKRRPLAYIDLVTADTVDEDKWMAMGDKSVVARTFMTRTDALFRQRLLRKYGKLPEGMNR